MAARRTISNNPEIGEDCTDLAVGQGYLRFLLLRSHYWVYYRVDHSTRTVTFASLLPTSREDPILLG